MYFLKNVAARKKFREEWESLERISEIARNHGVSKMSVYREAKRGETDEVLPNGRPGYDPEKAQKYAINQMREDGRNERRVST